MITERVIYFHPMRTGSTEKGLRLRRTPADTSARACRTSQRVSQFGPRTSGYVRRAKLGLTQAITGHFLLQVPNFVVPVDSWLPFSKLPCDTCEYICLPWRVALTRRQLETSLGSLKCGQRGFFPAKVQPPPNLAPSFPAHRKDLESPSDLLSMGPCPISVFLVTSHF